MQSRQDYSARKSAALRTGEKDSLSWPTIKQRDTKPYSVAETKRHSPDLPTFVLMNWPSPRATDETGGYVETEQTRTGFKSFRMESGMRFGAKLKDAVEYGQRVQEKNNMNGKRPGQLNPEWVEQLMGLPVGWTELEC